jgi:hypothetical protein
MTRTSPGPGMVALGLPYHLAGDTAEISYRLSVGPMGCGVVIRDRYIFQGGSWHRTAHQRMGCSAVP